MALDIPILFNGGDEGDDFEHFATFRPDSIHLANPLKC